MTQAYLKEKELQILTISVETMTFWVIFQMFSTNL